MSRLDRKLEEVSIFSPLMMALWPLLHFGEKPGTLAGMELTVELFRPQMIEALQTYEKHVVCLKKTPEDCQASLVSLMEKAIKAYESRGPNLRHGIALDQQVTIILSQTDGAKPLCGIYFNLHSPYQKKNAAGRRTKVERAR